MSEWYHLNINDMQDDEFIRYYSLMGKEKQQRIDRFYFAEDKKRSVAGEMLARKAISEKCNIEPSEIVFSTEENGKPFALNTEIHFNISHSEDYVVCAINDSPIGIDIEKIRPVSLKTAKKICNNDELVYIFGHIPSQEEFSECQDSGILTRFFEIWTKKEAYGKYTGEGLCFREHSNNHKFETIYDIDGYVITICK